MDTFSYFPIFLQTHMTLINRKLKCTKSGILLETGMGQREKRRERDGQREREGLKILVPPMTIRKLLRGYFNNY